jgi:enolase
MEKIDSIIAEEIRDSRGKPTIAVTLRAGAYEASAKVPSGKSAGSREACELRDADGVGVSQAIANVNTTISAALVGAELDPLAIDKTLLDLDGTENKTHLGANAMLGVSMAACRLAAIVRGVPLWKLIAELSRSTPSVPRLYMNMLNGGAHASFRLPFQEYIVVVGGEHIDGAYKKADEIFVALGALIKQKYGAVPMGDEGGYSPDIHSIEEPFRLLRDALGDTSDVFMAIDAAASEFFAEGKYHILGTPYTSAELLAIYNILGKQYNLKSIEDPFDEDDLSAFETMTKTMGERMLIVGDDLTVTNPRITKEMVHGVRANAMIVKPNQIGTMSEVFETVAIARDAGWKIIASHRSGETDDTFISDLAVGIGAYGLKAGAPTQHERRVKYERLIEIEKEINGK